MVTDKPASTPSKPFPVRLRPIVDHYVGELVKAGAYGKSKHAVLVRFIENGVVAALQGGVLDKKHIADFPELQKGDGKPDQVPDVGEDDDS